MLGVPADVIARELPRFGQAADDNAGRANVVELGGVRLIIDYAHNPHGMAALADLMGALPAKRRLVLIGQAGDRPTTPSGSSRGRRSGSRPDRVVLKEMDRYLRGRRPGEIPALMAEELHRLGMPPDAVSRPGGELASVRDALEWARPGDLLLLTLHQDRPQVLALLEHLLATGWQAGDALPAADGELPEAGSSSS